ncbi:MAG: DNA polymerase III subunit delta' [Lachnospiraceae bacterium]
MPGFNEIVGYEGIIQHLQAAIEQNKVSHAYIINGETGSGKKLLASAFAQTLQCEEKGSTPCGKCKSCIQAESSNHPDIMWITHEKYSIGVDDIRIQINNDMGIKPYSSPYKIYIVNEGDKMTEQAQNAILKTIEEPPDYGIVLLLTNNTSHMLPTILSRCVRLDLKALKEEQIVSFLMEKYKLPDYEAKIAAQFSQGNMGKAIRYGTTGDFLQVKEEVLHVLKYMDKMEITEIIESVKKIGENKLQINDCIDFMQLWYRDVLMLKVTNDPNTLLFKEEYRFLSQQAKRRGYEEVENIMRAMDKAKTRLNANVNFDLTMELMLLTLKECRND